MVSGLVTSPEDQDRICLDDASPILMASKLLMSINGYLRRRPRPRFDEDSASGLRMSLLDVLSVLLGFGLVGLPAFALGFDLGFGLVGRLSVGGPHARQVDAE